ncbi:hypothetical protein HY857_02305 [Candidatus Saccharibacteria bacterium]|nr:hypothetical protein [Candidatus Saccharibacteria bacterium]
MATESVKYPQFINMDAEIKAKYLDPLVSDPNTIFFKQDLGEAYLMAGVYGFMFDLKKTTKKIANIRVFDRWQDQYKVLFRVIAAADKKYDFEVLLDGAKTLKIVEEYANGGAQRLYEDATLLNSSETLEKKIWGKIKAISSKTE